MYNVRLMDAIMSKLTFFLSLIKMINLRSEMVSALSRFQVSISYFPPIEEVFAK